MWRAKITATSAVDISGIVEVTCDVFNNGDKNPVYTIIVSGRPDEIPDRVRARIAELKMANDDLQIIPVGTVITL